MAKTRMPLTPEQHKDRLQESLDWIHGLPVGAERNFVADLLIRELENAERILRYYQPVDDKGNITPTKCER